MLLCLSGRLRIEAQDGAIDLDAGELCIIPGGVEHRTSADEETHVLVFEPIGTRDTGGVEDPELTTVDVPMEAIWDPRGPGPPAA